jgi:anti-sigma regulatory factor (Ser/Thr protein kinase)
MAPHHGMPPGHLPVRSYLAVPVVSRSGDVLGGLFLGHSEPGAFTERAEASLTALAAQTAIAMDNARLYGEAVRASEQARREVEERTRAEERLAEAEAHQRAFLRDVLASVTDGRLCLCDGPADLPRGLPPVADPVPLNRETLRVLRRLTTEAAQAAGLGKGRCQDLLTAVNEAAMNAVVHAGGGEGRVCADADAGVVQVWIEDKGAGIEVRHLPQATLHRGYTTAGTLGHGFKLLLNTADRVWLLTGPTGTTVVLEQGRHAPPPGWLSPP